MVHLIAHKACLNTAVYKHSLCPSSSLPSLEELPWQPALPVFSLPLPLPCQGAFHPAALVLLSPSAQGQEESSGDKREPEPMVFGRVMCTSVGSRATSSSDLQSSICSKDAVGDLRVHSFHLLSCSLCFFISPVSILGSDKPWICFSFLYKVLVSASVFNLSSLLPSSVASAWVLSESSRFPEAPVKAGFQISPSQSSLN